MHLFPLSETSVLIRVGRSASPEATEQVHGLCDQLARLAVPGLLAVVPGITDVTIFFTPETWPEGSSVATDRHTAVWRVCRFLEKNLVATPDGAVGHSTLWEISVRYGGSQGPDLDAVCQTLHLRPEEVIDLHCSTEYQVQMLGFLPGFPYLGPLPEALRVARRATPRLRVEAGSVAIAATQTGIYPQASPGGWQVIGQTDFLLFDAHQCPPARLQAGDRVRFIRR